MATDRLKSALAAFALGAVPAAAALLPAVPALAQVRAGSLDVPLNKSQVVTADRPVA